MPASLARPLLLLAAVLGFAMVLSSLHGVTQIDRQLQSHIQAVPVKDDCPPDRDRDRPAAGREV